MWAGIVEATKAAKRLVAIDGCPVKCAQKTLEQSGFNPDVLVVVTDLGIEKIAGPVFKADECKAVMDKVKEELGT